MAITCAGDMSLAVDCDPPVNEAIREDDTLRSMSDRERILRQTASVRERAEDLLRGLIEARARSATRLPVRRDAYAKVAGHSAIDKAIDSTRKMVETLRWACDQAEQESYPPDGIERSSRDDLL